MRDEPVKVEILGERYEGIRDTDSVTGTGHIELTDWVTGEPVARVTRYGRDGSMTLDLNGKMQSREFVEELFRRADFALA
jgi:hypothetical protein